jgi:hypothetical protein
VVWAWFYYNGIMPKEDASWDHLNHHVFLRLIPTIATQSKLKVQEDQKLSYHTSTPSEEEGPEISEET